MPDEGGFTKSIFTVKVLVIDLNISLTSNGIHAFKFLNILFCCKNLSMIFSMVGINP